LIPEHHRRPLGVCDAQPLEHLDQRAVFTVLIGRAATFRLGHRQGRVTQGTPKMSIQFEL
jgi:hypothetical protein